MLTDFSMNTGGPILDTRILPIVNQRLHTGGRSIAS